MDLLSRLWARVQRGAPGECWPWTGAVDGKGYGTISDGGRSDRKALRTHRLAYEALVGPIPAGMDIDHLCRNRVCCNPAHHEPTTRRENVLRGAGPTAENARKTECPKGHALDGENVYLDKNKRRSCRECRRAANRAYRGRASGAT